MRRVSPTGSVRKDRVHMTIGRCTLGRNGAYPVGLGRFLKRRRKFRMKLGVKSSLFFRKSGEAPGGDGSRKSVALGRKCGGELHGRPIRSSPSITNTVFASALGACGRCPVDLQWYMY